MILDSGLLFLGHAVVMGALQIYIDDDDDDTWTAEKPGLRFQKQTHCV